VLLPCPFPGLPERFAVFDVQAGTNAEARRWHIGLQSRRIGGGIVVSDKVSVNEQISSHLKQAQELRRIAAALSLRQARATVIQAAVEHEQLAASLSA
jgi:hypothetical protein